ncbi:MAG TPA: chitobiase/beta-hexosaminidase C-terminal domain-containing protein, partial [Spirochaetota bacterium]|nr:chitobiase/beta-hexosaminidase C-terminal domain-containing protein [Spirochaetota bacterium]
MKVLVYLLLVFSSILFFNCSLDMNGKAVITASLEAGTYYSSVYTTLDTQYDSVSYTLDGSDPGEKGILYKKGEKILIDKSLTIKAIASYTKEEVVQKEKIGQMEINWVEDKTYYSNVFSFEYTITSPYEEINTDTITDKPYEVVVGTLMPKLNLASTTNFIAIAFRNNNNGISIYDNYGGTFKKISTNFSSLKLLS